MSANLLVDLGNTCQLAPSLYSGNGVSGQVCGLSGMIVGEIVDMLHSDTYCNVYINGKAVFASGNLIIGVQSSDALTSGSFTDPTSGLSVLPTVFQSGGVVWINSGSTGGVLGALTSGQAVLSGFMASAAFQRPGRYARLVFMSGFYLGTLQAGFISQFKTTGSGGGFSYSPSSGTVNV